MTRNCMLSNGKGPSGAADEDGGQLKRAPTLVAIHVPCSIAIAPIERPCTECRSVTALVNLHADVE